MKRSVTLLLFVALLLPVRGALAVTGLLCHTNADATAVVAAHGSDHRHGEHNDGQRSADRAHDHEGGPSTSHSASCDLCSSICGAPPLPSSEVVLDGLFPPGAERFPETAPPHVAFASGGPERPPRSI